MAQKLPKSFKNHQLPSLAIMHRTCRPDLRACMQEVRKRGHVVDLLVEILGRPSVLEEFSIYLQETASPSTNYHANT